MKTEIKIKNWKTNKTIISGKYTSIKKALKKNKNIDFSFADLRGVDLSGARLKNTDFYSANFEGANFNNSNFEGANFSRADMRWVTAIGAKFKNTKFQHAHFKYSDFRYTNFKGADFSWADFGVTKISRNAYHEDKPNSFGFVDFRGADLNDVFLSELQIRCGLFDTDPECLNVSISARKSFTCKLCGSKIETKITHKEKENSAIFWCDSCGTTYKRNTDTWYIPKDIEV